MLPILHTHFETRLLTCAPERETSSKQIAHRNWILYIKLVAWHILSETKKRWSSRLQCSQGQDSEGCSRGREFTLPSTPAVPYDPPKSDDMEENPVQLMRNFQFRTLWARPKWTKGSWKYHVPLDVLLQMPLNCMEAHFLSRKLLFGSFQKTYGSQTPPVLNLYFLEALFACSFFTVWFLPLLREPFHVVFPGCVL